MFDHYSYSLFNELPSLPDISIKETRRILTKAYMYSMKKKLVLVQEEYLTFQYENLTEEEIDEIEEEITEETHSFIDELYHELRRLGDTLESNAVFDNNKDDTSIKSSSFVAAESLSLLATLIESEEDEDGLLLSNELIYTRLEAAMLFLISGYDANAQTEVKEIEKKPSYGHERRNSLFIIEKWFLRNLTALITNKLWSVDRQKPILKEKEKVNTLRNIVFDNKVKMYSVIGDAVIFYIDWLTGKDSEGLNKSIDLLSKINRNSYENEYALYPEIYHFSKVLIALINETSKRSFLQNTPLPKEDPSQYFEYLKGRIIGSPYMNSRPFIWESAKEFISKCLPGPNKHTIVNQPTGSGKSFIAELAVTQSLYKGWVLYLAPTNALVHQIRRDLKKSLQLLGSYDIKSFVGGDEYTKLDGELVENNNSTRNFIAVMTPEKCAMSLRVNPDIFENCSLCVFDECHLLGENIRGATVDLVFGQILSLNDKIKFVLMSAMLENPNDIAEWLKKATNDDSQICSISWKPTRSVRGAVGVNYHSFMKTGEEAKSSLDLLPEHRRKIIFEPELYFLYSTSGIWKDDYADYSLMATDIKSEFSLSRRKEFNDWKYRVEPSSWVNTTASRIGVELALREIPTIVFVPTNRHYPFSLARKVKVSSVEANLPELEKNLLLLAERELGVDSEVRQLLVKGVGVHTSFMLDTEKEAVEISFINQKIKLLFATGTLAQGLNLPSVAVVIAGTIIGDVREAETPEAQMRSKALILNALGRAGRAGFSNQSLSLIVPNRPIMFKNENNDIYEAIRYIDVLQENDASITIQSPLGQFLNNIINGIIQPDRASLHELTIISMLTSDDGQEEAEKKQNILRKTYAASTMSSQIDDDQLTLATNRITNIKNEFLKSANAPDWAIKVSRESGFDFFTTNIFINIINDKLPNEKKEEIINWDIIDWKNLLFSCMKNLPPYFIQRLLPDNITKKNTFINKMAKSINDINERDIQWEKPDQWDAYWDDFSNNVWLYMNGRSYAEIAGHYLEIDEEIEHKRSSGKPIPDAIALVKRQFKIISSFAGLLVAILEERFFKGEERIPFNLNVLPLAIKNGVKDHSSFYWYSFGLRNRLVAHILGRNFPLGDFIDEEKSKTEVLDLRRLWLRNQLNYDHLTNEEVEILEAASMIIEDS